MSTKGYELLYAKYDKTVYLNTENEELLIRYGDGEVKIVDINDVLKSSQEKHFTTNHFTINTNNPKEFFKNIQCKIRNSEV